MAGTLTASIIKNDTTSPPAFQNSAGTEIGTLCRAWVNFNGTTSPGTIRASFNVSSVTKNGTGDYGINFTSAFADTNYAVTGSAIRQTSARVLIFGPKYLGTYSTTTVDVNTCNDTGPPEDSPTVSVSVFR